MAELESKHGRYESAKEMPSWNELRLLASIQESPEESRESPEESKDKPKCINILYMLGEDQQDAYKQLTQTKSELKESDSNEGAYNIMIIANNQGKDALDEDAVKCFISKNPGFLPDRIVVKMHGVLKCKDIGIYGAAVNLNQPPASGILEHFSKLFSEQSSTREMLKYDILSYFPSCESIDVDSCFSGALAQEIISANDDSFKKIAITLHGPENGPSLKRHANRYLLSEEFLTASGTPPETFYLRVLSHPEHAYMVLGDQSYHFGVSRASDVETIERANQYIIDYFLVNFGMKITTPPFASAEQYQEWIVKLLIDKITHVCYMEQNNPNNTNLELNLGKISEFAKSLKNIDAIVSGIWSNALHIACASNCFGIVTLLVQEFSASVNTPDNDGFLPIHYAIDSHNVEMVKLLKDHNTNMNYTDSSKRVNSPYLYAQAKWGENSEIAKLLCPYPEEQKTCSEDSSIENLMARFNKLKIGFSTEEKITPDNLPTPASSYFSNKIMLRPVLNLDLENTQVGKLAARMSVGRHWEI